MTAKKFKPRSLLLLLVIGVALSWGVYECKYYYSQWSDYRNRPWAYSRDENAPLLVGKWTGNFKDPDNIAKSLEIEIFVPVTDEERGRQASKHWGKKHFSGQQTRGFDGIATVTSKLGQENYEIYGAVEKDDFHQFHVRFRAKDEKNRILRNFAVITAEQGNWSGDQLHFTLGFTYLKANGASYYSSADPRYSKKVEMLLKRKNQ